MQTWRDQISKDFVPHTQMPVLAIDPDSLLSEEKLNLDIRSKGFEIIPFEDITAFRLVYESKYREQTDRGEEIDLLILVQSTELEQHNIPFDVTVKCKKVSIRGSDLLYQLSPTVVSELGAQFFDEIEEALSQHQPPKLGEKDTKEFILKNIFDVDVQSINDTDKLLHFLIRYHYRGKKLPPVLEEYLLEVLNGKSLWQEWSLDILVHSESAFYAFLQERWPVFLERSSGQIDESKYELQYPGPLILPFDQLDVRVYVDNLFNEGLLDPVPYSKQIDSSHQWANVGILAPEAVKSSFKLNRIISVAIKEVPGTEAHYTEWIRFAFRWAEIQRLLFGANQEDTSELTASVQSLQEQIDQSFHAWIDRYYGGLYSQPANPPVMIHHIPRFLSKIIDKKQTNKVALLVIDGLSLAQWLVIKNEMISQARDFSFDETAVFSWIPTTTNVSRQALFSGKLPMLFSNNIQNLTKESALWKQFWNDHGFNEENLLYLKVKGQNEELSIIENESMHPKQRVLGIIVEKVDQIMHGMKLGSSGMINQVRQWASMSFLKNLLLLLLEHDFSLFITSDHGNIEAEGIGRISEGSLAETQGQRVRVYSNSVLREKTIGERPELEEWPQIGLPDNYLCLLAPKRKAFVNSGDIIVTHGGACIEEVIVPFVSVSRRGKK